MEPVHGQFSLPANFAVDQDDMQTDMLTQALTQALVTTECSVGAGIQSASDMHSYRAQNGSNFLTLTAASGVQYNPNEIVVYTNDLVAGQCFVSDMDPNMQQSVTQANQGHTLSQIPGSQMSQNCQLVTQLLKALTPQELTTVIQNMSQMTIGSGQSSFNQQAPANQSIPNQNQSVMPNQSVHHSLNRQTSLGQLVDSGGSQIELE